MPTGGEKAEQIVMDELRGETLVGQMAGNNRYIAVTKDTVLVGSVGAASGSLFGRRVKRYPLDSITTVDVRKAMFTTELEIVMAGAVEAGGVNAGFMERALNENITAFPRSKYDEVQQLARLILDLKSKRRPHSVEPRGPESIPDQIRKLAELRDAGILTSEEFDNKKTELLRRL